MNNSLIISSSSKEVYIGLKNENNILIKTATGRNSGSQIIIKIDQLLKENKLKLKDIKNYFIDIGPGSFTGIRISIVTLQGLLMPFEDFSIRKFYFTDIVNLCLKDKKVVKRAVLKRAREDAAYIALYENEMRINEPEMVNFSDFKSYLNGYTLLGEEALYFKNKYDLKNDHREIFFDKDVFIDIEKISKSVDINNLKPLYLQKPLAVENFEKITGKTLDKKNWD
ncbi:hypothetical protein OF820_12770 [Oceanotoga sp. DSM 15011]|uniref:hypothetical protein n=1 Tax=Oceanotoga sp. DSM 15011 TaxID=2984951 RepID=UPI0021F42D92|nr:hypothetical protein [Oceanotoga sp. DSM 15011]UYO99909.1 hypothetical protein OF820_12770 [Oceanotoga sp. DSM 15011]